MQASINEIHRVLPHRPPFLFIDKVTDIIPCESGIGKKLVTADEELLSGNNLIFPHAFFIEIMAQTCAMICAVASPEDNNPGKGYLAGFDLNCTGSVQPGDVIQAHVSIIKIWGTLILAKGSIMVDDTPLGQGRFTIGLLEPIEQ